MKRIVFLVGMVLVTSMASFSLALSDEVKEEANNFTNNLSQSGITENTLKEEGLAGALEKNAVAIGDSLSKLPDNEDKLMAIIRYLYSQETSYYNFCGMVAYNALLQTKWDKKFTKQEIVLSKLLPIAIDKNGPNDFRLEVLTTISAYFDKGILETLNSDEIKKLKASLGEIIFDKTYNLSNPDKKIYGLVFDVRAKAISLLEKFDMDSQTFKNFLMLTEEENGQIKERLMSSVSNMVLTNKLNDESKQYLRDRLIFLSEKGGKNKYAGKEIDLLCTLDDKESVDFILRTISKTENIEIFKHLAESCAAKKLSAKEEDKIISILEQRLDDKDENIRKVCVEMLIYESKNMDKEDASALKTLFLKARESEKNKEIIQLLNEGITLLKKADKIDLKNNLEGTLGIFKEQNVTISNMVLKEINAAIAQNKLDKTSQTAILKKLNLIIENKNEYPDIFEEAIKTLANFEDKTVSDHLIEIMSDTDDVEMFATIGKYIIPQRNNLLKKEVEGNRITILKKRIYDENPGIRRSCIWILLDECKKSNETFREGVKKLFLNAKEKENKEYMIRYLDKGIKELERKPAL